MIAVRRLRAAAVAGAVQLGRDHVTIQTYCMLGILYWGGFARDEIVHGDLSYEA